MPRVCWHSRLSKTQVYGDLVALSNVTELWSLDLSQTKVSGDVVALKNAKNLEVLGLSETKVSGDLVALSNATDLRYLDLSETKVHGDMGSLATFTKLAEFAAIQHQKSLAISPWFCNGKKSKSWAFRGTEVTSHPTEKWQKCCEHLKTLDLSWSKIHIVDGFLANFESYDFLEAESNCPFPSLTALDMTGTPLNITVVEAAQTLRWMQRIANVQSCGVQLDRADAKPRHWDRLLGRGARQWNRRLATEQSPWVVGSVFQQCHQSAGFTSQLSASDLQRQSTNQFRRGCREEGRASFCVAGPSECHVRTS